MTLLFAAVLPQRMVRLAPVDIAIVVFYIAIVLVIGLVFAAHGQYWRGFFPRAGISIYFFIGITLLVNGVLIFGASIGQLINPPAVHVVL